MVRGFANGVRRAVVRSMAGAALLVAGAALPLPLHAQPGPELLFEPIDVRAMTVPEIRAIQTFLAFEGHYVHLTDGDWGPATDRAMAAFSRAEFGSRPVALHLAGLFFSQIENWVDSGWASQYRPDLGITLLLPTAALEPVGTSGAFENWHHIGSSLAYAFARTDRARTAGFHDHVGAQGARGSEPYLVRKDGLAVTSVTEPDGGMLYARSDFTSGAWSTVILSTSRADTAIGQAVASSIAKDRQGPIAFSEGGYVDTILTLFLDLAEEDVDPPQTVSRPPAENDEGSPGTSGSGFVVSADGRILTNAHVVEGCREPRVDDAPATIEAVSDMFDLALLHAPSRSSDMFARFAARPAELNSDVTVAGYPLFGILEGLNVTRGAVSSLKGLRGDDFNMQISAPVQPGNSGGPVFDRSGNVVGVVVSRLDKRFAERSSGALPENVNFAIGGEIAKLFLAQNAVPISIAESTDALTGAELGRLATAVTVLIACD